MVDELRQQQTEGFQVSKILVRPAFRQFSHSIKNRPSLRPYMQDGMITQAQGHRLIERGDGYSHLSRRAQRDKARASLLGLRPLSDAEWAEEEGEEED